MAEYRCDNYDEIMAAGNVAGTLRAPDQQVETQQVEPAQVEAKVVQAPENIEPVSASGVEVETKAAE